MEHAGLRAQHRVCLRILSLCPSLLSLSLSLSNKQISFFKKKKFIKIAVKGCNHGPDFDNGIIMNLFYVKNILKCVFTLYFLVFSFLSSLTSTESPSETLGP